MLKNIALLFVWILLVVNGAIACRNISPATQAKPDNVPVIGTTRWVNDFNELPKGAVTHVDVVYFHRSVRCEACLNAENFTRETLDKYFADQMQSGLIALRVIDMEKPENAALVSKFDAAGSSLYLSVLIQDTEYLCANPDIWFYTGNKYLFVETLRKKLDALVEDL